MALICKRFLAQSRLSGCLYRGLYTTQMQCAGTKALDTKAEISESYEERNTRLRRPQSPHLDIYKPQLTSILSISHRFTGMALSGYMMALGLGALVLSNDLPHYLTMIEDLHLNPWIITSAKFLLAFPFGYHYCNGIRHLFWDMGKNLTLRQVYVTGYIMLAAAVALAAFLTTL